MRIKLLDVNRAVFNSSEEVGFSIVTLMELTKGLGQHDRNQYFKKFVSIWEKDNYHIYIPLELKELESDLIASIKAADRTKQNLVLFSMCEKIMVMVFVFFSQMICLFVIAMVFINHNLIIEDGQIPINSAIDKELADYNNYVVILFKHIFENQSDSFKDYYKDWNKNDGNEFGNKLLNYLLKKYLELTGRKTKTNIILCGNQKNIKELFNIDGKRITYDRLCLIYKSYFTYKINPDLIQKLFMPYLLDAMNNDSSKFEFNHISDSFLIFNAITAQKSESCDIDIDSDDTTLSNVFALMKQNAD